MEQTVSRVTYRRSFDGGLRLNSVLVVVASVLLVLGCRGRKPHEIGTQAGHGYCCNCECYEWMDLNEVGDRDAGPALIPSPIQYNWLTDPASCDLATGCSPTVCQPNSTEAAGACAGNSNGACEGTVRNRDPQFVRCYSNPSHGDTCSCPGKRRYAPTTIPPSYPSGGAASWQVDSGVSRLSVTHRVRDDSDPLVGHVITRMPCDTCDLSLEELVVRAASIDLGRDIYEFSDINLHIRGPVLAARQQDGTFVLPQDALEASIWYRVDGLLQSTTEIVDRPVTITIDWSAGTIELEPTIGLDENTTATIHVLARTVPNVAPNALATTALATVECTGNRRATVQLRGSDSSDADGDPLSFVWVENFRNTDPNVHAIVLSHEANPSVSLELGVHDISLQVTDPFGNEGVARVVVEVVDTQAPTGVTATVAPDCLWPTNNRWRTFDLGEELQVQAIDTCSGAVSYALTAITAVEGSGAVSEGYALLGTQSFCVQAKRSGRAGSSRTYRVEGLATDPEGNTSSFDVAVQVPHNSNQCSNPVSATSAACEQALVQSDAGVPPSISSDKILATDDANRRERAHASDHVSGCSVASRPLRSSIGFVSLMSICTILVASLRRRSRK